MLNRSGEYSHRRFHMPRVIRREDVVAAFAPCVPLLRGVIVRARDEASTDCVAEAHPRLRTIGRQGHIRRIAGTLRWLYVAEDLVAQLPSGPSGFSVLSNDLDHSRGRFAFCFPGGVFTVRRQPHQDDDENVYIQERLETLLEQAPMADGLSANADLTIYIGVPPDGPPKLHVVHPSLADPMTIALDEFDTPRSPPFVGGTSYPQRNVSSDRKLPEADDNQEKPSS